MSLPPTNEAFELNVMRAHFQCAIWLQAMEADPPALEPTEYGWTKPPTTLPEGVDPLTVARKVEIQQM